MGDLHKQDEEIDRIALLAFFSLKLLGDTFPTARVGSSMHSNLKMHHISGDSLSHPTWCSAHTLGLHEMRICI